jgi:hypothetical protein
VSLRRLLVVLLLTGLGACAAPDGDDPAEGGTGNPEPAAARLERQRSEVRAAARTLLRQAERRLGGRTALSTGAWRGCESGGIEEYRNFRYLAQARVDVAAGAVDPALTALRGLRGLLEDAGFSAGEVRPAPSGGGRRSLAGTRRDLTVVFSHAGGTSVGLDVYGPCVDVPERDRDAWLRRDEPTPDLVRR